MQKLPGLWQGVLWALRHGTRGGTLARLRLAWRALAGAVWRRKALRRWMAVVAEQHSRGLVRDVQAEYLRALRPFVHRGTGVAARVAQLIEHTDWLETALTPASLNQLADSRALVLADMPAPRGYDCMQLQLRQAPWHAREGSLLLTLTLQRSAHVQHGAPLLDAAVLALTRFRIAGQPCLVIGGVRGQRHPVLRLSPVELSQALQGWKPPVLMVRVAQELARHWGLKLVGLDPASHRLQNWSYQLRGRHRETAMSIYRSYDALWEHFGAQPGPAGWMVLPGDSDDKLEATALSPEKRQRQVRRADYWIRIRKLLRQEFRARLLRPDTDPQLSRVTQSQTQQPDDSDDPLQDEPESFMHSRSMRTGPVALDW